MKCVHCRADLAPGPYTRRDTCPGCGAELRSCVHCALFAPGLYNECREPQAERVLEKERANFCDYFRPGGPDELGAARPDPKSEARARLDALFPKKR